MNKTNRFPADDEHKGPKLVKTYYGSIEFLYDSVEMRRCHTLSNKHKYKRAKRTFSKQPEIHIGYPPYVSNTVIIN
jgi:hypothetical protein